MYRLLSIALAIAVLAASGSPCPTPPDGCPGHDFATSSHAGHATDSDETESFYTPFCPCGCKDGAAPAGSPARLGAMVLAGVASAPPQPEAGTAWLVPGARLPNAPVANIDHVPISDPSFA
jgi:hypothetical protein